VIFHKTTFQKRLFWKMKKHPPTLKLVFIKVDYFKINRKHYKLI
jgi:hypothetical protein